MEFRSSKGRDKVWSSEGPPYPLAMLSYLRFEQSLFEKSSPSPQKQPAANQSGAQDAGQPAAGRGASMTAAPGAPEDDPCSSDSGNEDRSKFPPDGYVTPPPSDNDEDAYDEHDARPRSAALRQ